MSQTALTLDQLLGLLRKRGVQLWVEGPYLHYLSPDGELAPDLLEELGRQKSAVIEFLRNTGKTLPDQPPLLPVARKIRLPLSFAQERLWFLDQLESGRGFYNIPIGLRLKGRLNASVLQRCLGEIMRRHEALRTRFQMVEGQPVQVIQSMSSLAMPVIDLSGLAELEQDAEARRLCTEETQRPFDLAQGPVLRAKLIRLGCEEHLFVLVVHHIASDGWSLGLLVRELKLLYQVFAEDQPSPLPELPIQYADYALWQRDWLQGEALAQQVNYWKQQLAGAPELLALPTDRPRPAIQSYRGALLAEELPRPLLSALQELSRQEGGSLFMILLAAFQTLLHRHTGVEDVLVGSPIANRNRVEVESLIGFFVNTLVLRGDLSGDPSFRTLLRRTREVALGAYAHQDLPFEKLVEALQPERNLSHSPLFQVMFVLQNAPAETVQLAGLEVRPLPIEGRTSKFDLTLFIREREEGLSAAVEYNTDLFEAETIRRMLGHYRTLLGGIVANPEQRVSQLPLLTATERRRLLVEWNDTAVDYPREKCGHQLFEEQVEKSPEVVAVVLENERLTYRQLNERANRLAHYLRKLGVGPETLVGICMERSLEMVVGLLGILKAGGAYVPLDPSYPQERLAWILEDSGVGLVLTQQSISSALPEHQDQMQVICLDQENGPFDRENQPNPAVPVQGENLAYVLYTSGSTGKPKGVAIVHRNFVSFATWAGRVFTHEEFSGVLFSTSICFDLSVFELFVTLANGGTVILARNALELPALPAANEVRMINTVPSVIAELVRTNAIPRSVITVNLAGEPLAQSLVDKLYEGDLIKKVYDLYGPTETTTYVTFTLRSRGGKATIGRPVANTQIYILDACLQPVPIGIPGELYVGGAQVGRGYLHRSDLTAEKFIPDQFTGQPGARLYKTGDRCRWLPDGNIEFLGRLDHQVKLRGFRVELGEIESVLMEHSGVREAVVVVREDLPGDRRLVAYVAATNGEAPTASEWRGLLQSKLPDYMIPSAFVIQDRLPLTPNGKVDRRALPKPEFESAVAGFIPPRTPAEMALAGIWCQVLGVDQVGVRDNFFELGGHSLLATRILSRMRQYFEVNLPLRSFFASPTVEGTALSLLRLARNRAELEKRAELFLKVAELSESEVNAMLTADSGAPMAGER